MKKKQGNIEIEMSEKTAKSPSPARAYERAGWFSRYSCAFMLGLARIRWTSKAAQDSSYLLDDQAPTDCRSVAADLGPAWGDELARASAKDRQPSLMRALAKVYRRQLILSWLLHLFYECLMEPIAFYLVVQLIGLIGQRRSRPFAPEQEQLTQLSDDLPSEPDDQQTETNLEPSGLQQLDQQLWLTAVYLVVFLNAGSLLEYPYLWRVNRLALQVRLSLSRLIYAKSLKVDRSSSKLDDRQQVLSLISKDLDQLNASNISMPILMLSGPLQFVIYSVMLANSVGWLTVVVSAGLTLIVFAQRALVVGKVHRATAKSTKIADELLRLTSETLTCLRVIRLFGWMPIMRKRIDEVRKRQLDARRFLIFVPTIDFASFFVGCSGGPIVSIAFAHYIIGVPITQMVVSQIFMVTVVHRSRLTWYFPQGHTSWINMRVSINRLQDYLLVKELTKQPRAHNEADAKEQPKCVLQVSDLSVYWRSSGLNCLSNVTFAVQPGELVMIVGQVGSGKSSLLQTIVGELTSIRSGHYSWSGQCSLSYATQDSWLHSGTLRQNILAGEQMDSRRYLQVLHACALAQDLRQLPDGDLSEIGQLGVSLSGGQRARINLARCLYRQADVYLLDDPLSALDARVARQVFKRGLREFLAGKTVILVSHQVQFAEQADKVVALVQSEATSGGSTAVFGTHSELLKNELTFALLTSHTTGDRKGDADEPPSVDDILDSNKTQDDLVFSQIRNQLAANRGDTGDRQGKTFALGENERADLEIWPGLAFYFKQAANNYQWAVYFFATVFARLLYFAVNILLNLWAGLSDGQAVRNIFDEWLIALSLANLLWTASAIVGVVLLTSVVRSWLFILIIVRASRRIHSNLLNSLLSACMSFHDRTPVGDLINLVSTDINFMDEQLMHIFNRSGMTVPAVVLAFLSIVVSDLKLAAPLLLVFILARFIIKMSVNLTWALKRADSDRRGEIYSHVSLTLDGLSTIRTATKERLYERKLDHFLDRHSSILFLRMALSRLTEQSITLVTLVFCSLFVLTAAWDTTAGGGAFAFFGLNMLLPQVKTTKTVVNLIIDLSTKVHSLNRIKRQTTLPPELDQPVDPLDSFEASARPLKVIAKDTADPSDAASAQPAGSLEFVGVSLAYSPGEFALRGVSFSVDAGEKVGVVGRTGAGKSSLLAVLFRLYHFEGLVLLDGQDTKRMRLDQLRSSLAVIPQDPTLFSGTLRLNLDPTGELADEQLWRALECAHLADWLRSLQANQSNQSSPARALELQVGACGEQLSVGQRQLVCLARAILRKSSLLLLDEATANVDQQTDQLIQSTIRDHFQHTTVITIAHRLATVADSDKILVLDGGRVSEFGRPAELVQKADGQLARLLDSLPPEQSHQLRYRMLGRSSILLGETINLETRM